MRGVRGRGPRSCFLLASRWHPVGAVVGSQTWGRGRAGPIASLPLRGLCALGKRLKTTEYTFFTWEVAIRLWAGLTGERAHSSGRGGGIARLTALGGTCMTLNSPMLKNLEFNPSQPVQPPRSRVRVRGRWQTENGLCFCLRFCVFTY